MNKYDQLAELIERLLGCLEPGTVDVPPLNPRWEQRVMIPTAQSHLSIEVRLIVTDDGKAVRWMVLDYYGTPIKTGFWTLSKQTYREAVEAAEKAALS